MIYYKARTGWTMKGNIAPKNISEINILDTNAILPILTGSNTETASILARSPDEVYNEIVRTIGDEVYTWYGFPPTSPSPTKQLDYYYYATEWIPSLGLIYKKASELAIESYGNGEDINIFLIVDSIGMVYKVDQNNKSSFIIGDNGDLTQNSGSSPISVEGGSGNYIVRISYCANYDGPASLVSGNMYYLIYIVYNENLRGYQKLIMSSSDTAELFGKIVSESIEPDGTGPYEPGGDGPYGPGGSSGPGDLPPGTFDDSSDPIPDSSLPTLSASDTGFTRIYNPTLAQIQALARYLWTEPSIIETIWNHIKQFFEDPMQAIIGFNLVPCRVPDGGTKSFALMFIDTGVQMTAAANQFVDVDCGTFTLERYYGSALDQNPYTKVSCFLPYIGTVHLNTDEVMGTTLQVKYRIDIVSGSCVAKILVDGSVLYQYSGHCAITIPISAADFSSYVSSAIAVGTAVAGMAVGAAAGAAVPTGTMIPPPVAESAGALGPSTGLATIEPPTDFQLNMATFSHNMNVAQSQATAADFAGLAESAVINTAGQTMGSKMQVEHSGSFSGNSGYLGVRRPFLIIERPNMCLPATYGQLNGYPSMITLNLGECSGFTRVQQVQLTGCTATNPEQSEILQFLKSGVVL